MDSQFPYIKEQFDLTVCKSNTIYNIYECGCIIEHKKDILKKKKRERMQSPSDKSGNRKQTTKVYCGCKKSGRLITKYKRCQECGKEYFSNRLSYNGCNSCKNTNEDSDLIKKVKTRKKHIPRIKKYGQMDKIIKSRDDLTDFDKGDCLNREKCLELTFSNFLHGLACKNCEYYKSDFEVHDIPCHENIGEHELNLEGFMKDIGKLSI